MIVYRLIWPVLQRRLKDPHQPRWFHARVQETVLRAAPPSRHRPWAYGAVLGAVITMPLVAFFSWNSGVLFDVWVGVWVMTMVGLPAILAHDVAALGESVRQAPTTYAWAVQQSLAALTWHERLRMQADMRRLPG